MSTPGTCKPLQIALPDQYHWEATHDNDLPSARFRAKIKEAISPFYVIDVSITVLPLELLQPSGDRIKSIQALLQQYGSFGDIKLAHHQCNDRQEDWFYTFQSHDAIPRHPQLFLFYRKTEHCFYSAEIEITHTELSAVPMEAWINIFSDSR